MPRWFVALLIVALCASAGHAQTGRKLLLINGQRLWTPSQLGTSVVGWWDTTKSVITLNSTNVASVSDLSSGGNTLVQATGANQPAYSAAGLNGLPCVSYAGTNLFLATAGSFTVAQPFTIVSLFQTGASLNNFAGFWDGAATSSGTRAILFAKRNDLANDPAYFAGTLVVTNASPLSFTTNYLSVALLNGASSSHGFNGATPTTGNPGTGTIASGMRIGSAADPFTGLFGFAIIVNRVLTTIERQKLEGYAAWQFGLNQVVLPSNHPYYNVRPTI